MAWLSFRVSLRGTAPAFPLIPVGLAAIAVATVIGCVVPLLIGSPAVDDSFVRSIVPIVLFVVAISNLIVVRYFTLPQMVAQYRAGEVEPRPSLEQFLSSVRVIALAFSVAPAIYGVVAAVMTGLAFVPLPFSVVAVIILLSCNRYVEQEAQRFRTDAIAHGEI
jgi:hypothetical protein